MQRMDEFSLKEQVVIRHLDDLMISIVAIRPTLNYYKDWCTSEAYALADWVDCYLYKIATIINGCRYYYVDNIEDMLKHVTVGDEDFES